MIIILQSVLKSIAVTLVQVAFSNLSDTHKILSCYAPEHTREQVSGFNIICYMSKENSCAKRVNFELMGVDNKHPLEQNFENYNETDPMHLKTANIST